MKERPILFSGPMVQALLAGRKTQTRRVVKPQPVPHNKAEPGDSVFFGGALKRVRESRGRNKAAIGHLNAHDWNPYGVPGDRLWCRESWRFADWTEDGYPLIRYAAGGAERWFDHIPADASDGLHDTWAKLSAPSNFCIDNKAADRRWRPSIHMPRWASRITLEVVSVRVERVQDISEKDAVAESFKDREDFFRTFYDLNKRAPRTENPWVWVVEFRRITP